jgi:hypothetical protein
MIFEIESKNSTTEIDVAIRGAAARQKFGALSVIIGRRR